MAVSIDPEALLAAWERGAAESPPRRALRLLAAAWPEHGSDDWSQISIGQRDARLIELREFLFGARIETVTSCPRCSEALDLTFHTADVRLSARPPAAETDRAEIDGWDVAFRAPTTADLLAVAECSVEDARAVLLSRCVREVLRGGAVVEVEDLPPEIEARLIEQLAKADPQADVQIEVSCPGCAHRWNASFDILSQLWAEVEDWARRAAREVHAIARAYGWAERDILRMSPARRRLYLDCIGATR